MQVAMQHGVFLFGCVEMDDAGAGPPAPTDRRYTQEQMWHAATRMLDMGVQAEELGFDTFWLTEHHFQHEGYEVIPNGVLFGAVLGERTTPHQDRRHVPHRPAVASAALRRGLRHDAQPLGGPGRAGSRPRHRPPGGAAARHAGRLLRQPGQGRGRPHQPRDDGRGDGRHPRRLGERDVQLPRLATGTSRRPASPIAAARSSS